MSDKTIKQVADSILEQLKRYIRSQYNISDQFVIKQRDKILDDLGVIHQQPFIENTPKYKTGDQFKSINLPKSFSKIVKELSTKDPKLIFDPPYSHQLDAVKTTLVDNKSSLIMTGTGSGKTESFLWPILGKLSKEADESPASFEDRAVRALVLYPMNALVNDQLGRMRKLYGDQRVKDIFLAYESNRIPTFARYTSRTPYAGKRLNRKDRNKFKGYEDFYVRIEDEKNNQRHPRHKKSKQLFDELNELGKWPAKESVSEWHGPRGGRWGDEGDRLKRKDLDSELLSRHEVQSEPPDVLITNFSMLSYMMLRPIEKNIFDKTKEWLKKAPDQKLLIVFDEAHLYTGSQGAEVALLMRRLISRLKISEDQLQIIITSASFSDKEKARRFASQLSSVEESQFEVFKGEKDLKEKTSQLSQKDIEVLSSIDLGKFQSSYTVQEKAECIKDFLKYRGVRNQDIREENDLQLSLFNALKDFYPLNKLKNKSMGSAKTLDEMSKLIFPSEIDSSESEKILTILLSMATFAKEPSSQSSLFPSRLHLFLRGLPGLWACLNQNCTAIDRQDRGQVIGKLYSQPRDKCKCGSNVFEYYTCRYCGSDFAKAFIDDVDNVRRQNHPLWTYAGETFFPDDIDEQNPVVHFKEFDLLLKKPHDDLEPKINKSWKHNTKQVSFDPITARLSPKDNSNSRNVFYAETEHQKDPEKTRANKRRFLLCPICRKSHYIQQNQSPVQNHQTKGVEPIKAIASEILRTQSISKKPTSRNPLGGRKLLFFSDSREKAASLVKRFDDFAAKDAVRPMVALGYKALLKDPIFSQGLNLDRIYYALLLGSRMSNIRLRFYKTPSSYLTHEEEIFTAISSQTPNSSDLAKLMNKIYLPSEEIIEDLVTSIFHNQFGLYPLAIAQLVEDQNDHQFDQMISELEDIPGIAEDEEQKKHLVRIWLYFWAIARSPKQRRKPWFSFFDTNPDRWWLPNDGYYIQGQKRDAVFEQLGSFLKRKNALDDFKTYWLPRLVEHFTASTTTDDRRLLANKLSLSFDNDWGICNLCRSVQIRASNFDDCIDCDLGKVQALQPDQDEIFKSNNEYSRKPIIDSINNEKSTVYSMVTKEHTAQLNATSTSVKVFSMAERNELTFQDIELDEEGNREVSTDILSSTTTMEVGIDIGALSAVGLRGMPPARSNYQQRAGRAGRRGNSIAIVMAWGNVDSHDEHYFSHPREMISGEVSDPFINLENKEIAERHVISFLFEKYLDVLTEEELKTNDPGVFSVLGTVTGFRDDVNSPITLEKIKDYVATNEDQLREQIRDWLPKELCDDDDLTKFNKLLGALKEATDDYEIFKRFSQSAADQNEYTEESDNENIFEKNETPSSAENDRGAKATFIDPKKNELLPRLIFKGILPKYGFPSDVISFYVFSDKADGNHPYEFKYQPTHPLSTAIRLYAPGESTTIGGKIYQTYGIYSLNQQERSSKYNQSRTLYFECTHCGHVNIMREDHPDDLVSKKTKTAVNCDYCSKLTLGPPKWRLEPVGFAHGYHQPTQDNYDSKLPTRGTRVKSIYVPSEETIIKKIGSSNIISVAKDRGWINFTNVGPSDEGFDYCSDCGHTTISAKNRISGAHEKPYPDNDNQSCNGQYVTRGIALGTEYITDLLWINFNFESLDVYLGPGKTDGKIVLTTVANALAKAATNLLQIDPNEISVLYRHEKSDAGVKGKKFEVILFDTLANGAGYCTSDELKEDTLIKKAIEILKDCPENCDSSCYRCLRVYHNKYDHYLFDRYLGQIFLETALSGNMPTFNTSRLNNSIQSLVDDLKRYGFTGTIATHEARDVNGESLKIPIIMNIDGEETWYSLSNPLTRGRFFDENLQEYMDSFLGQDIYSINELEVRKALPQVTQKILKKD